LDVIGINDRAWRRNHSYGTIVCDLERRRPVTLLRDREQATTAARLAQHQKITVIARDRSGGYGEAALALPPNCRRPLPRKGFDPSQNFY
jgi:transposase